jgi:hypothetical protein
LFIDCNSRPVVISNKKIRWFKVEIVCGVFTTGFKTDVGEDSTREGLVTEIEDAGVTDCEGRVYVINFYARVGRGVYGKLSKFGNELPTTGV